MDRKTPVIRLEDVDILLDTRYIKVADLRYAPGKHYYDVSRRAKEDLLAVKEDEQFASVLPDAVTCFVIIRTEGMPERLLLSYEYRYPLGRFMLSPPAGLIDEEDRGAEEPLIRTALREIKEETGLTVKDTDRVFTVSPMVISSPGFSDESNALVCAVVDTDDLGCLDQSGAVGGELFDGFYLPDVREARELILAGKDPKGDPYPLQTWAALMYFMSGLWKESQE